MREMSDSLGHRRCAHGYKFGYMRPRKRSVIFVEMSGNVSISLGLLKGLWIGEVRSGERKCGFCGCRNRVRSPECYDTHKLGGNPQTSPAAENLADSNFHSTKSNTCLASCMHSFSRK